ncbi:hypothetical protein BH09ACT7_BH09ACT7_07090 [soil metagenome]
MTVLSRGARARRGGRRPGWLLLTVLLVLAIAASSALVFTNRVELLKLAVILALWAAVVGAFVSVIYRRQSDADAAKVRDLKLVYDLQLDREISARREYELTVETHLRRELSSELRAQASDEVAALRAELAALRTNLEILFDADLAQRPAIETDRAYAEWTRNAEASKPDRVTSSRITSVARESLRDADTTRTAESPIIDVPEEPLAPPTPGLQPDDPGYRGSHRRPSEDSGWLRAQQPTPKQPPPPPRRQPPPQPEPEPVQQPPTPQPSPWVAPPPPAAPPVTSEPAAVPNPPAPPPKPAPVTDTPAAPSADSADDRNRRTGPPPPTPAQERRGRHSSSDSPAGPVGPRLAPAPPPAAPPPAPAAPTQANAAPRAETPPAPRHRSAEEIAEAGPSTGGQSVAELLARLQAGTTGGGGGRRRRED